MQYIHYGYIQLRYDHNRVIYQRIKIEERPPTCWSSLNMSLPKPACLLTWLGETPAVGGKPPRAPGGPPMMPGIRWWIPPGGGGGGAPAAG